MWTAEEEYGRSERSVLAALMRVTCIANDLRVWHNIGCSWFLI